MIAWFDGALLPLGGVSIPATDRGFLLGDGFFETMAACNGQVIRFNDHMDRLENTAAFLKTPLRYTRAEITAAIHDVLIANGLANKRAALRLTVTRGSGPRGILPPLDICPHMLISASEAPDHFPAAKVKTVSLCRNEKSPTSRIKSLCYMDNILAMQEAKEAGADEALMLNTTGKIAEGSISNIFFLQGKNLLTPSVEDGALPGVMRKTVLSVAAQMALSVQEASLTPDIIQTCDEAFLTNSLFRLRAIFEIDGRAIPSQTKGDQLLNKIKEVEKTA
jgi:branched-chain amino acid aminotransferase